MTPHEELTASQWLRAGLGELASAERAFQERDQARGIASCKRAAGMALNAALLVVPRERWGRSYVDHLGALGREATAPAEVRAAATLLAELTPRSTGVVTIITKSRVEQWLEAARTVMAHAYAVVHGSAGRDP
jgi:HEPN domain-containing protein